MIMTVKQRSGQPHRDGDSKQPQPQTQPKPQAQQPPQPPASAIGEGATPLMYACQQGRDHEVHTILLNKPEAALERDRTRKTALHYCAETASPACAELLLASGAGAALLAARDEDGYSALHLAVIAGNRPLIQALLARGAPPNCLDHERHSLVHWATVCGEVEALELVLRAGADPSTPDAHGGFPLHYAAQMCGPNAELGSDARFGLAVLRRLLAAGVAVDVADQDGRQPLLWAASAGSADAILALVNAGASVEADDKDGLTALHCAASRGHTACLEALVTLCGAEVDVIDTNGCSALFYTVTLGHADATRLLLGYGAEPNRQDRKGRTPAHCGAAKGQLETLRLLAAHGANLWVRNVKGDYPLHEAVASGRKELVRYLLTQRHDAVNAPNNDGRCPLHVAAINNNIEMVKILLDGQALLNPVMRSARGALLTPMDAALHRGHRAVAKYLQLHGGVPAARLTERAARVRGAAPRAAAWETQSEPYALGERAHTLPLPRGGLSLASSPLAELLQRPLPTALPPAPAATPAAAPAPAAAAAARTEHRSVQVRVQEELSLRHMERHAAAAGAAAGAAAAAAAHAALAPCTGAAADDDAGSSDEAATAAAKAARAYGRQRAHPRRPRTHRRAAHCSLPRTCPHAHVHTCAAPARRRRHRTHSGSQDDDSSAEHTRGGWRRRRRRGRRRSSTDDEEEEEEEEDEEEEGGGKGWRERRRAARRRGAPRMGRSDSEGPAAGGGEGEGEGEGDGAGDSQAQRSRDPAPSDQPTDDRRRRPPTGRRPKSARVRAGRLERAQPLATAGPRDEQEEQDDDDDSEVVTAAETAEERRRPGRAQRREMEAGNRLSQTSSEGPPAAALHLVTSAIVHRQRSTASEASEAAPAPAAPAAAAAAAPAAAPAKRGPRKRTRFSGVSGDGDGSGDAEAAHCPSEQEERPPDDQGPALPHRDVQVAVEEGDEAGAEGGEEAIGAEAGVGEGGDEGDGDGEASAAAAEDLKEPQPEEKANTEEQEQEETEEKSAEKTETVGEENTDAVPESEDALDQSSEKVAIPEDVALHDQQTDVHGEESTKEEDKENGDEGLTTGENGEEDAASRDSDKSRAEEGTGEEQEATYSRDEFEDEEEDGGETERAGSAEGDDSVSAPAAPAASLTATDGDEADMADGDDGSAERTATDTATATATATAADADTDRDTQELEHDVSGRTSSSRSRNGADSGFEPSPRRDTSASGGAPASAPDAAPAPAPPPRPRVARLCRTGRGAADADAARPDVSSASVTKVVQHSVRKYHSERLIFQQLLELKRLQIRAGRANENVLVKRLADEQRRAGPPLGTQPFEGPYTFRAFERHLYDQLRALQAGERLLVPRLQTHDDLEKLQAALRRARLNNALRDVPDNPVLCTHGTHRCHHAAHAYTGVPCAAYITKSHPHGRRGGGGGGAGHGGEGGGGGGFLPRIDLGSAGAGRLRYVDPSRPVTLELSHGRDKQVIALPTEKLDRNKRYFVTFTIKGGSAGAMRKDPLKGGRKDANSASAQPQKGLRHHHAESL